MTAAPTTRAMAAVSGAVGRLAPVDLDTVLARAALQTRTDRKYVVPLTTFTHLVAELGDGWHALDIDRRRLFDYESVYFDTRALRCYHDHVQGRRHRFKVRTRTYVNSAHCVLEVKANGRREETVKSRLDYDFERRDRLDDAGVDFVADCVGSRELASVLVPSLATVYRRATLVDLQAGTRLTCDVDLRCIGHAAQHDVLRGHVLVESKSTGSSSHADGVLRRLGVRPVSISKYCAAAAVLDPGLPANRWNRTLRRYFDWQPSTGRKVPESWRGARGRQSSTGTSTASVAPTTTSSCPA
jgi:hypothetical protein